MNRQNDGSVGDASGGTSFYRRAGLWILVTIVFLLPFTFKGARRALLSNHNDVKEWLPDEYEETREFTWFRKYFAGEQFVLMSWEGAKLSDTTKMESLAADLRPPADPSKRQAHHELFAEVTTGPELLGTISKGLIRARNVDEAQVEREAKERLNGLFIGPDGDTTAMVVTLSDYGADRLRESVNTIRARAAEVANLSRDELKIGGPPVDNVALDEEGESALFLLAGYSVAIGLVVSWWCLRSMPLVVMVFITGIYGGMLALAIVYYTNGIMNAILLTMPSLVYVAATSGAIHLANYYRDGVAKVGVAGAPLYAVRHALLPLSLATGTTTVGLLSLYISELVPIKTFGLYSAAGVTATLVPLLLLMPAMLEMWPVTRTNTFVEALLFFPRLFTRPFVWVFRKLTNAAAPARTTPPVQRDERYSWVNPIEKLPWAAVGENVVRYNMVWLGAMACMMGVCAYGVTKIETSINLMRFFAPESKIRSDYAWLEQNLGPLVPMEVVVRFEPETPLNMLERVQLVQRVHREVEELPEVGSAMSPATFIPPLPGGKGGSATRTAWARTLNRSKPALLDSGYLEIGSGPDAGSELWRVSARVQAVRERDRDMDYGAFVDDIKTKAEPAIQAVNARINVGNALLSFASLWGAASAEAPSTPAEETPPAAAVTASVDPPAIESSLVKQHVHATYTGLVPLVYKAQRSLMDGLKIGFIGDWILIAIVMMIVVRDVSAGFLLMIPSAFPALIVFGVMGLAGIVVDTGTVMAPAVALGVTVDDVVHFMLKFRDKIRTGGTRREAIMAAYAHCAQPMYQSWGVIGLGLSVFALSHFMPTQRFGWMMVTLLTASTIGNLILLPAVLASPLGKLFTWSIRRQTAKRESTLADEITGDEAEPTEQNQRIDPAQSLAASENGHGAAEGRGGNGRAHVPHERRHDKPHVGRRK